MDAPPIGDGDYLAAWHLLVLPVLGEFAPDVIIVSAGFGAAADDPIGVNKLHLHPHLHPHLHMHLIYTRIYTHACMST